MKMEKELKHALLAADAETQYDEKVKRLLGNKIILAHILVRTMDEFQGMAPVDVVPFIEGEPFISVVPVEPGLTNAVTRKLRDCGKSGQRITGMNTELTEIVEGLVRFDIIFYVRMKDGISQMIVNLEAQKDAPSGYRLLNRAVYYVCRMISSQKERDFINMNYNDIKKVFSIWICMNMNENSTDYVHLVDEKLAGSYSWEGGLDLLNIVLVGIAKGLPDKDEKEYELHRLLNAVLSVELPAAKKFKIMKSEYDIEIDDQMREDVSEMCNLGQGVFEAGEARGEARGITQGIEKGVAQENVRIILNMYQKGYSLDQIADITDKTIEEIETIIEKKAR